MGNGKAVEKKQVTPQPTVDIRTLKSGDKFTLDGESYIIDSFDLSWDHVHVSYLEKNVVRAIDFGTKVVPITKKE